MAAEIAEIALALSQRMLLSKQASCLSTTVNYERKLFIKSFWLIRVKKSGQVPIRNSKNKVWNKIKIANSKISFFWRKIQ